jgi:hypothetical protein
VNFFLPSFTVLAAGTGDSRKVVPVSNYSFFDDVCVDEHLVEDLNSQLQKC